MDTLTTKMNLTNKPTKEQLLELFTICENEPGDYMISINYDGTVNIFVVTRYFEQAKPKPMGKFYFKIKPGTFGGFTCKSASRNPILVDQIFDCIIRFWGTGAEGYVGKFNIANSYDFLY